MYKKIIATELLKDNIGPKDLYELKVAHAYSMASLFRDEDLLYFKKLSCREIRIGDIIAYQHGPHIIAHRCLLIGKEKNGKIFLTTKGDCARRHDPYVITEKEYMGKIVRMTRQNKTYDLNSPWWWVINHLCWLCSLAEAALVRPFPARSKNDST